MSDTEAFAMFGAFSMTFILLWTMFAIKLGPIVGGAIGFAAAVCLGVMGYAIWSELG